MTYENLLKTAGFNDVEQGRLISLSYRFPEMKTYAEAFMSGDRSYQSFENEVKKIDAHVTDEASVWALHMVFLCHAFSMLDGVYEEQGIPFEMHIFENGPHGISTADKITTPMNYPLRTRRWIDMSADWIEEKTENTQYIIY